MVGLAGFEPAITWVLERLAFPKPRSLFRIILRINQSCLGAILNAFNSIGHALYLAHNPKSINQRKNDIQF